MDKENIHIMSNTSDTSNTFNFQQSKKLLLDYLIKRNKTESESYEDVIKNYNNLLVKTKSIREKVELLERENNSLKRISGDPAVMNDLQSKVQTLEKELNETMKENKTTSTKLCEILTDKMMMKDQIETLTKQNITRQARILELDEIVKNQDAELIKLREDNQFLKSENGKLEKQNITLNENLNKKIIENNNLINEILTIKNDYMVKMNEMLELVEHAKKKKEAADIYFDDKKKEAKKNSLGDINLMDSVKDFQVFVEDVQIPHKLKIKLTAHRKNITSLKFNNFGTNFLTTGVDTFIKMWDAAKNMEIGVFTGFTGAVSGATFDHTEQYLFAGSLDKTAKLWSLKNNKLLVTFTGHIDYINCVNSYHSAAKALTGSSDRTFKEWDFGTLKLSRNFNCVSSCVALGIAADDSFVVSGHMDGTLKFWSSNDKPEKVIDLHDDKITSIEFIKNENMLVTLSKDYTMKLFDLRKMETLFTLGDDVIPQYCESNISVSSDKKYIAVGSTKGQIYVVNAESGKLEDTVDNKSTGSITAVQWRPYHSQFYVGDSLGSLSVWGTN